MTEGCAPQPPAGPRTAQRLFAQDGLGVPLDETARHAGVGPGTSHRHLPTRGARYLAVVVDELERLVADAKALSAADDPADLFTQLSRMVDMGRRTRP